jgi:hypothetical protein
LRISGSKCVPPGGQPQAFCTSEGYIARKHDYEACALKPRCSPNTPAPKIARSIHEAAARDKARAITKTEAYAVSRRERKKVKMLFADLKCILGWTDCVCVAEWGQRRSSC